MKKLPKGIRKHSASGYIVDISRNGKRVTKTYSTLILAIKGRQELLDNWQELPAVKEKEAVWTLKDAVDRTLALYWQDTGGGKASRINANTALSFFGPDIQVGKITPEKIADYLAFLLEKGLTNGTINRKLFDLSRCLRTALEHGKLAILPKMPARKIREHRIRFLTEEEEEKLLSAIDALGYGQKLSDVILCLLYTGFRTGELWKLEARDINLEANTLTTWETKNNHARTIPIAKKILPIIVRNCQKLKQDNCRLFPYSNAWLEYYWNKIRDYMELSDDLEFVPHMLRHTCATRLARAGVSIRIVKEWLGHSNIQTTMRYAHFSQSDLTKAASVFDV